MNEKTDWKQAFNTNGKMNETVRKLYDASKELRDTDWGERVTYINFNTFAELIVRECLMEIERLGIRNGDTEHNLALRAAWNAISDKFGGVKT